MYKSILLATVLCATPMLDKIVIPFDLGLFSIGAAAPISEPLTITRVSAVCTEETTAGWFSGGSEPQCELVCPLGQYVMSHNSHGRLRHSLNKPIDEGIAEALEKTSVISTWRTANNNTSVTAYANVNNLNPDILSTEFGLESRFVISVSATCAPVDLVELDPIFQEN